MRLTLYALLIAAAQALAADGYAQATKLSLTMSNTTVKQVLSEIEDISEFYFLYNSKIVDVERKVDVNFKNKKINEALDVLFKDSGVKYNIVDRQIVLSGTAAFPGINPGDQQRTVTGTVTDNTGQPLPGVTVVVKGTTQGAVTNVDGQYTIPNLPENATLQFSFVGMKMQEVVVGNQTSINVSMVEDAIGIEEVVAIGYGTQRKVSTTSPISQITGDELTKRPINNIQQSMQGLAPGVTILDNGGYPGREAATIRVRGITTLGNNNPLVLVDGIEQRINDINPNDIESISILKDAASTAIYGSRAANGVVLVTTKRGDKNELNIAYSGFLALHKSNNNPEHMEVGDYMRLQNVAYTNAGRTPLYTDEQINTWVTTDDRINYPLPNDWFNNKDLVKTGFQQDHNIALSGGSDKIQGRASIRWQENDGILSSVFNALSEARTNLDFSPNNRFKLSADLNYRQNYSKTSVENVFQWTFHAAQWIVPRYPDGTYGLSKQNRSPLVFNDLEGRDKLNSDYFIGNFKAEYKILDQLKFTGQYSLRSNNDVRKIFRNAYTINNYFDQSKTLRKVDKNSLTEIRDNSKETTLTALLDYAYTNEIHEIKALIGYSEISNERNYLNGYREFFYNNEVQSISMGSDDNKNITGFDSEWGLRSFFGRVNYIYNNKYIFEANARGDGSSRFTGSNAYAFFPSISGAWRVTEEEFWNMENDFLNEFKLRASWGKSGNQAIPLYEFYPALVNAPYTFNDQLAQGFLQTNMANSELTWETTTQTNIGFDSQFLHQKLSLSFDWYKKTTDGILLQLPVPGVVGLNAPQQNAGIVENKGVEILIGLRNKFKKLNYNISANMGYNANKIISLSGTGPYISTTQAWTPVFIKEEGHPIDSHYGYLIDGFFQSEEEIANYPTLFSNTKPGDVKYIDRNKDEKITPDDMTHLGNSFPNYSFGLTSTLTYDNFEFFMLWQGAADFSARIDGALGEFGNQEGFTHKILTDNYWTEDRRDAKFPRPVKFDLRNVHSSELNIIDASYFRLKMMQVAYNLPSSLLSHTFIKQAKLTISGTDLITFSKLYKEWNIDPEAGSRRGNYYPQTSVYSFGFIFQF